MHSRSAVFNSRSVVVEPYYNANDPATIDTPESLQLARKEEEQQLHPEDKLKLVEDRQSLVNQEIATLRATIEKKRELAGKYAKLTPTIEEAKKGELEAAVMRVMTSVFALTRQLYQVLKTSGKNLEGKVVASSEVGSVENEVTSLLESTVVPFAGTFLHESLNQAVMNELIAMFKEYADKARPAPQTKRGYPGKTYPSKRAFTRSMYQIDNRSREVVVKDLPSEATETDVITAMRGYFGVKRIEMRGNEAVIEFEEPWQTQKPTQTGLFICNKVGAWSGGDL